MTTFTEAAAAIYQALGLPPEIDENGCTLMIENKYSLNIRRSEDGERLLLTGAVAEALPQPLSPFVTEALLECSLESFLTGAPAAGLDRDSGLLVAYTALPLTTMSNDDCVAALFKFLEFQINISEMIRLNAGAPEVEGSEDNQGGWVKA